MNRITPDHLSEDGFIQKNKRNRNARIKRSGDDAAGDSVDGGIKRLVYKMYGEYLENLRKPYTDEMLKEATK